MSLYNMTKYCHRIGVSLYKNYHRCKTISGPYATPAFGGNHRKFNIFAFVPLINRRPKGPFMRPVCLPNTQYPHI